MERGMNLIFRGIHLLQWRSASMEKFYRSQIRSKKKKKKNVGGGVKNLDRPETGRFCEKKTLDRLKVPRANRVGWDLA